MVSAALSPDAPRTALVLSGGGRYNDPWHPFDHTSPRLAALLEADGWTVEINDDPEAALLHIADADQLPDLVVANFGLPRDGEETPLDTGCAAGLRRLQQENVPILVMHVSITSLINLPLWATAVGGRWIRGQSMHPDFGDAHIQVIPHPLTAGLHNFTLQDERYTDLEVDGTVDVLASHHHSGRDHPLVWLHPMDSWRIVYDGLGHTAESFESPEHQELIRRSVRWLTETT